jgi:DNA processing protein
LIQNLKSYDPIICSGLARGIDVIAHRADLKQGMQTVACLAHTTVVIEPGEKGGSMKTANLAHQYGLELFVVLGRYSDYKSQGCHQLLVEQKTQLISKPEHLIDALGWETFTKPKPIQKEIFTELTQQQQSLIQSMQKNTKVHLDVIALDKKQKIGVVAAA